jgi:hypothetical protein
MSSIASSAGRSERIVAGRLPRAVLIAALLSAVLNAIVFFVIGALGVDLTGPFMGPDAPPAALSVVQVIIASAVPAVFAGLLLWLLGRFAPRPVTIFVAIAAVFALLSLGGPLTLPVSGGLQIALALMHIVSAAAITWALVSQTRAR